MFKDLKSRFFLLWGVVLIVVTVLNDVQVAMIFAVTSIVSVFVYCLDEYMAVRNMYPDVDGIVSFSYNLLRRTSQSVVYTLSARLDVTREIHIKTCTNELAQDLFTMLQREGERVNILHIDLNVVKLSVKTCEHIAVYLCRNANVKSVCLRLFLSKDVSERTLATTFNNVPKDRHVKIVYALRTESMVYQNGE